MLKDTVNCQYTFIVYNFPVHNRAEVTISYGNTDEWRIHITTFWSPVYTTIHLKYIIADDEHTPADHDVLDIITHSPYTDEDKLTADLTIKHNDLKYSA